MKALLLIFGVLCGCTIGSTTSDRSALDYPPIGPDGVFWSAIEVARGNDANGFLHIVSPRFLNDAFLSDPLAEPQTQNEFDEQRRRINSQLIAAAARNNFVLEAEKLRMAEGYMAMLREATENRLVEVGAPNYGRSIVYKDEYGRAAGPNRVWLDVKFRSKSAPAGAQPRTIRVGFVQDEQRWLIDTLEPDDLRGAYTWAR